MIPILITIPVKYVEDISTCQPALDSELKFTQFPNGQISISHNNAVFAGIDDVLMRKILECFIERINK